MRLTTDILPLAVVGVDFRRASTRWRAAMALDGPGRRELHHDLAELGATGLAELATCNRTEWIAVGEDPAWLAELMKAQVVERFGRVDDGAVPRPYVYVGEDAARHVLRVSVGLESLARGEPHIARQAHEAFARAREESTACSVLNVLETVVGRTVRRVGRASRSRVRSAGMHRLVADALADLPPDAPVLVVGMGAIGRRVAERLAEHHVVVRVNRTARDGWLALDDVLAAPPPHVAAVLCTGAPDAVWGPAQLTPTTQVVVDIGSPPQVDAAVADHVRLLDLDALVTTTLPSDEIGELDEAIAGGLEDLRRALGVRALRDLVRTSRDEYRHLTYTALPHALDRVRLSPADRQTLEAELRELLKDYAGRVLDAVEQLALETSG